jgi:hypothetical protein
MSVQSAHYLTCTNRPGRYPESSYPLSPWQSPQGIALLGLTSPSEPHQPNFCGSACARPLHPLRQLINSCMWPAARTTRTIMSSDPMPAGQASYRLSSSLPALAWPTHRRIRHDQLRAAIVPRGGRCRFCGVCVFGYARLATGLTPDGSCLRRSCSSWCAGRASGGALGSASPGAGVVSLT